MEEAGACYKTGVADVADTWRRAQLGCQAYGAELYYINTEQERVGYI